MSGSDVASGYGLTRPRYRHAKKPAPGAMSIGQAVNAGRKQLTIKQQIVLSEEQKKVLSMVVDEGKSVFFTGSAGESQSCASSCLSPDKLHAA